MACKQSTNSHLHYSLLQESTTESSRIQVQAGKYWRRKKEKQKRKIHKSQLILMDVQTLESCRTKKMFMDLGKYWRRKEEKKQ